MAKQLGWKIMLGVSNSTITNGMYSDEQEDTQMPYIEVFVPELIPNAEGKPNDIDNPATGDPIDILNPLTGSKVSITVPKVHTLKCMYMGGQNTIIPCVHKGEQVWVLQYEGGEMSYYWLPMGRWGDEGIRLHEHCRWYLMNRSKSIDKDTGKVETLTDDCSYFIDINTNKGKKLFHIHTAKNDGEPYGYDIRIAPEKSWLEITDTAGNYLHLDSKNTLWRWFNIDQSYIELNKTDINLHCRHNFTITVGNDMITTVGNNKTSTIGVNTVLTSGSNITVTATAGNIAETAGAQYLRNAVAAITDESPVYNNLCQAVAFSGTGFTVTGKSTVITSDTIAITAPIGISFMGPLMSILNAHGTINGLGGW